MKRFLHVAGTRGPVQRCVRCDSILSEPGLAKWDEGQIVSLAESEHCRFFGLAESGDRVPFCVPIVDAVDSVGSEP